MPICFADTIGMVGCLLGAAALFMALQVVYLALVIRWADRRTSGVNYWGLSAGKRRRFKRLLRGHSVFLSPALALLAKCTRFRLANASFHFHGVAAPRAGACSPESFQRAVEYEPRADDLFVVTQMRCGTTWMQHLVFQTLTRGKRDLVQEDLALNAVSPWLEAHKTVALDAAPLIGDGLQMRIIKTHLTATLCPSCARAKYIYVVRHPVSCFASCVDFVRGNLRGFEPDWHEFLEWFTSSESMWWGTWVDHLDGWWQRARAEQNVLFVRFEDMKQDLPGVAQRVAQFLGASPLDDRELANIAGSCSFAYMQQHADLFEMHPPHLLQMPGRFFVSGQLNRGADLPPHARQRITDWCTSRLQETNVPIGRFYPDLVASTESNAIECKAATVC